MAIECLLFDVGKVLIDFDFERGMTRFVARSSLDRECFERVIWDKHWFQRFESGKVSTAEYHHHLREAGGLDMTLEEFREAWSAVFLPEPLVQESLLTSLNRRYPLVLLSNSNEVHVEFLLRRHPTIFGCFSRKVYSHEVGVLKPAREIYEAAIASAGKPPETLFFTDDREENIEAARQMGIQARQFFSEAGLIADLKAHGVAV